MSTNNIAAATSESVPLAMCPQWRFRSGCTVWSESSLGTFWTAKDTKLFMWTWRLIRLCRLIWVFIGLTFQKIHFLMLWFLCFHGETGKLFTKISLLPRAMPLLLVEKITCLDAPIATTSSGLSWFKNSAFLNIALTALCTAGTHDPPPHTITWHRESKSAIMWEKNTPCNNHSYDIAQSKLQANIKYFTFNLSVMWIFVQPGLSNHL